MRITKKMLEERLKSAEAFQRCEIMVVGRNDLYILRDQQGFVPACCYSQSPHKNELGRIGNTRLITEPLQKWRRPN